MKPRLVELSVTRTVELHICVQWNRDASDSDDGDNHFDHRPGPAPRRVSQLFFGVEGTWSFYSLVLF